MFCDPESLLVFCLLKGPVCFGTAKVETFSSSAKLIFYFSFRLITLTEQSATSFAGCKGKQLFGLRK
jgi:hypothetical protein